MKKIICFVFIIVFLSGFHNFSMSNSSGLPEDVNGDGVVDLTDLVLVYNDAIIFAGPGLTDVNGDGIVNLEDILLVYNCIVRFCPP